VVAAPTFPPAAAGKRLRRAADNSLYDLGEGIPMTPDQVGYEFGGFIGAIIIFLLLDQFVHWIVRKIRRKPRKTFRQWLTSWIAGPELLLFGNVCAAGYGDVGAFALLLGVAFMFAGIIIFVIKIIASIVSRFRRRAPGYPLVSLAVSPPGQTLGRQPPLG
jgi:hypothetical protein